VLALAWSVFMNKLLYLNLVSAGLGILAVTATFLGGIVLAFDKSLWPLDGQILYIGHICHLITIPVTITILSKGYKANPRMHLAWLITQATLLILSLIAISLLHPGMFNYGWWPS